uniref:RagB/SusD family nutrient uptake outer membrane protein n=1 Tax=uncultured Draconibacterium sp. TaxID=1573823 RepID=UPI003217552F
MKKKLIYTISLFSIITLLFYSCDYLDKQPDDMKTDEMIWSSRSETESYLYNVYSQIPAANLHQGDPWLGISDEIDLTWNVYPTYSINLGNWNPSTNFYVKWGSYYRAIRSSFVFENNVDKCPELSKDLKEQYKAEVKFLRGLYYFYILRQYGPAVLLTEVTEVDGDWDTYSRSPFDDCVSYIAQMMDEAEENLPMSWDNNEVWLGKPTKIACRAIKAEALMLAASPQWNGNNEYANFKNPDGTLLADINYDENKWKIAAQACKAVIDIADEAGVRLYKNNENGDGANFNPYKSVRDVLLKNWNCEVIFGRARFDQNAWQVHASPGPNNLGGVAPTQRVVDAFFMKNGRTINDPNSGYVETGFASEGGEYWNPDNLDTTNERVEMLSQIRDGEAWGHWAGDWNMYANREPRFYASILYNKRIIPQVSADISKRNYYSTANQQNGYGRVELYYGGVSRRSGSYTFYPRTGYLALKNNDPQSNMRDREYAGTRCEVKLRYAQILLDYIECLNEYDPGNSDIKTYWDMIRERAGVPGIFEVYPEIKGSKEQQREFIIQERQVELCFETDRYFTTRRRWLSYTPDNGGPNDRKYGDGGRMWGMNINGGNASTNRFTYTGFYERIPFEERVFEKKMYLFPIPQKEVDINSNLVQNPWW